MLQCFHRRKDRSAYPRVRLRSSRLSDRMARSEQRLVFRTAEFPHNISFDVVSARSVHGDDVALRFIRPAGPFPRHTGADHNNPPVEDKLELEAIKPEKHIQKTRPSERKPCFFDFYLTSFFILPPFVRRGSASRARALTA